jgi:hypothetical protein
MDFVLDLRKQRTAFVQSASQYQLLHTLVAHYCREALAGAESSTENSKKEVKKEEPVKVVQQSNGAPSSESQTDQNEEMELVVDI